MITTLKDGDTFSVDCTFQPLLKHPSSAPQPRGRRMFTVSLLPSGPQPVSATTGLYPLRGFDPCPPTSQDEVSTSGHNSIRQLVAAFLELRPPHTDGLGL